MQQNPCRYCTSSSKYRNRNGPSLWKKECSECENRRMHEEYLKSKRKFEAGDRISSIEELLENEWLMLGGYPKHIEVFKSMPLRTVLMFLNGIGIYKAIRKESEEK